MININFENVKLDINVKQIAKKVMDETLKIHEIKLPCMVNITFADSEYVRIVNYDMRGINKTTDVLSFPNIDFKNFKMDVSVFDAETKNVFLGDILINTEKIIEQSSLYGHTKERECAFLIAHSLLHLLSYDHMNKKEEQQMFSMQERILENIGFKR